MAQVAVENITLPAASALADHGHPMNIEVDNGTRLSPTSENSSPKNEQWEDQQRVIEELLQTEGSYLADLRKLLQLFFEPLTTQQAEVLPKEESSTIFSNIRAIADVHESLFRDLSVAVLACCSQRSTKQLTACFESAAEQLGVYSVYCANSQYSTSTLEKCRKKYPKFEKFISEIERNSQRLESFLIKPVQRVCRYPLLFTALLQKMPKTDPERADVERTLEALQQVANDVNEFSRKMESANKIFDLTQRLGNFSERLNTNGRLFKSERLVNANFPGEKRDTYFAAIFTDMILFAKPKGKKKLQFRCKMPFESTSIMVPQSTGNNDWPLIFTCSARGEVSEVTIFEASDRDRGQMIATLQSQSKPVPNIITTSLGSGVSRRRSRSVSNFLTVTPATMRHGSLPSLMIPEEQNEDDLSLPPITRRGSDAGINYNQFAPPVSLPSSPCMSDDPTDHEDAIAPKFLLSEVKANRRRSLPTNFKASPRGAPPVRNSRGEPMNIVVTSSSGDQDSTESEGSPSPAEQTESDVSEIVRLRLEVLRLKSQLASAEQTIKQLTSAFTLVEDAVASVRGNFRGHTGK